MNVHDIGFKCVKRVFESLFHALIAHCASCKFKFVGNVSSKIDLRSSIEIVGDKVLWIIHSEDAHLVTASSQVVGHIDGNHFGPTASIVKFACYKYALAHMLMIVE